jgi:hypothetical protein
MLLLQHRSVAIATYKRNAGATHWVHTAILKKTIPGQKSASKRSPLISSKPVSGQSMEVAGLVIPSVSRYYTDERADNLGFARDPTGTKPSVRRPAASAAEHRSMKLRELWKWGNG